jgi:hypothetical protein
MARPGLTVAITAALTLLAAGCSSGGGSSDAGDGGLAELQVLSTDVQVRTPDTTFESAESGRELGQGDEVRTDATGFAEVVFFDGSWQRIESGATLTLTELVDIEGSQVVRTGLDQGRAWQRVESLTNEEDAFAVDTPVAVASVRGTAFSIECEGTPIECTFSVVEGVVALELSAGTTVEVRAGQRLVVERDLAAGPPEDVGVDQLRSDDWIAQNLERDATNPPTAPGGRDSEQSSDGATGSFAADANAICATAGEQNAAIASGPDADQIARQQAVVLAGALDELEALEPPPELAEEFNQMIDSYRQRTLLVPQALEATADERQRLVNELIGATADGAAHARNIGLTTCVVQSD